MNLRNKIIQATLLGGLLLAFCWLPVTGCNTPPSTVAYKAETGADFTVTGAMAAWNAYVGAKHPGTNAELKVKAAYDKAKLAEALAIDATKAWALASVTNTAGTNVPPSVTIAEGSAAQALMDLVNLIQSFGVNITTTN
jgi:hypothetical protein